MENTAHPINIPICENQTSKKIFCCAIRQARKTCSILQFMKRGDGEGRRKPLGPLWVSALQSSKASPLGKSNPRHSDGAVCGDTRRKGKLWKSHCHNSRLSNFCPSHRYGPLRWTLMVHPAALPSSQMSPHMCNLAQNPGQVKVRTEI